MEQNEQKTAYTLNKQNLGSYLFTGTDGCRPVLGSILVDHDRTVASNSRVLIEVTRPEINIDDFPTIKGVAIDEQTPFLLRRETAQDILKTLPSRKSMPILHHAVVSQDGGDTRITTTDLSKVITHQVQDNYYKVEDYPKIASVYPKGNPVATVTLDASKLEAICKFVKGFTKDDPGEHPIKISLYGEQQPVVFQSKNRAGQTLKGCIAPLANAD